MGSGRANIDIALVCKIVALIFCIAVAAMLNDSGKRPILVSNSLIYAAGGFIIVVAIFLGWAIFQSEVDKIFDAWMMICGGIYNIGAGIGVILFYIDYKRATPTIQLTGGCLGLAAGIVLLVDALHNFGIF